MPPADPSSPQPPPPSTSWPPPPTGAAPPALAAVRKRSTSSGLNVAFSVAMIGWLIVGFVLFNVYVFTGRDLSCTGNRGDAYQSCVRQEDVTELGADSVAIGLSVVALVIVFRTLRQRVAGAGSRAVWVGVMATLLLVVCVAVWVDGSQGGWAPARPFPYEPISNVWGHLTMTIGVLVGALVGLVVPLTRRRGANKPTAPATQDT